MNICLYGASSNTLDRVYLDAAYAFGSLLAKNGHTLVYGGGAQGVATYIEKIGSELRDTMAMCGVHTLGEITRDCVRVL